MLQPPPQQHSAKQGDHARSDEHRIDEGLRDGKVLQFKGG